eukprot:366119-Chlamydomonas_euryale.AAC.24
MATHRGIASARRKMRSYDCRSGWLRRSALCTSLMPKSRITKSTSSGRRGATQRSAKPGPAAGTARLTHSILLRDATNGTEERIGTEMRPGSQCGVSGLRPVTGLAGLVGAK